MTPILSLPDNSPFYRPYEFNTLEIYNALVAYIKTIGFVTYTIRSKRLDNNNGKNAQSQAVTQALTQANNGSVSGNVAIQGIGQVGQIKGAKNGWIRLFFQHL